MQAGLDIAGTYPTGVIPVSFYTIIGEWSYLFDVCTCTSKCFCSNNISTMSGMQLLWELLYYRCMPLLLK